MLPSDHIIAINHQFYLLAQWRRFTVTVVDCYLSKSFCNSPPWTSATTLWDTWKHWKYVSKWSYYHYTSSLLVYKHNGVVSLSPLLVVIFWSFSVIPSCDLTIILTSLYLYIKREQSFGNISICNVQEYQSSVVIIFSVVLIHLVHFSVQVTTWWWSESSRGLIGTKGLCICLNGIVALVGHI